ncbi:MAG: hypothetical protein V4553_05675 [Bacteroidota bacterium]
MPNNFFHLSGIREISFSIDDETIKYLKNKWQTHVAAIEDYPLSRYSGKGIVICAGGIQYFTCAWVTIRQLRHIGCNLPIELWFSENELSEEVIDMLKRFDVICKKFEDFSDTSSLSGVMLKPLAIIQSQFEDVLFLDADNNCLADPSFLFNIPEYLNTGAVFWPDYWKTAPDNPIWAITDSTNYSMHEQESGQLIINKKKCWKEINLCLYFNQNHKIYHKMLLGDKDTFRFAWFALKSEFHMIIKELSTCGFFNNNKDFIGNTMVQHSTNSDILFLHRNLYKWDVTDTNEKTWQSIREFKQTPQNKTYILQPGCMNIDGDVKEYRVSRNIRMLEYTCLSFLNELRKEDFYARFFIHQHLTNFRKINKVIPYSTRE